jgi:AcrR family transcriptional regulator
LTPVVRSAAQTRILDAALGVTKAAVYHQFNTKDQIVLAVTEREMVKVQSALDAAVSEGRPQSRDALLDWVIDFATERRRLVSVLQFDPAC